MLQANFMHALTPCIMQNNLEYRSADLSETPKNLVQDFRSVKILGKISAHISNF